MFLLNVDINDTDTVPCLGHCSGTINVLNTLTSAVHTQNVALQKFCWDGSTTLQSVTWLTSSTS